LEGIGEGLRPQEQEEGLGSDAPFAWFAPLRRFLLPLPFLQACVVPASCGISPPTPHPTLRSEQKPGGPLWDAAVVAGVELRYALPTASPDGRGLGGGIRPSGTWAKGRGGACLSGSRRKSRWN